MAQIMSAGLATQAKSRPVLLSVLGSPSAGDEEFAAILRKTVLPIPGGVRIWREGDAVPYLTWGLVGRKMGYGPKSFAGIEVMLVGQLDPLRRHTQYSVLLGSTCVLYQFPEVSYHPGDAFEPMDLKHGGYAEVP